MFSFQQCNTNIPTQPVYAFDERTHDEQTSTQVDSAAAGSHTLYYVYLTAQLLLARLSTIIIVDGGDRRNNVTVYCTLAGTSSIKIL